MTSEELEPVALIPPLRFASVESDLYRGTYPHPQNIRFLKRLNLKTILSLTPEPLSGEVMEFAKENGIQLIHLCCGPMKTKSKKKRPVPITAEQAREAVEYMINGNLAPMYVHCLNGSEVTCLVIGCLRKFAFWSMASIGEEFSRYSEMEPADEAFLQEMQSEITVPNNVVPWIWRGLSVSGVVKNHPKLRLHKDNK
jgi:tyrosine-protein phosphatase OCA6